jgi:hypothetical protein
MTEKKKKIVSENFGKFFLDIGKLTFASFVLGTILSISRDFDKALLLLAGFVFSIFFTFFGVYLIAKKEE